MIISHQHKFIFFKARKVAGTSIEVALRKNCGPRDIQTSFSKRDVNIDETEYKDNLPKNTENWRFHDHITPPEVKSMIPAAWWEYYKFTVVRNPWDTIVSWYYWDCRDDGTKRPRPPFNEYVKTQFHNLPRVDTAFYQLPLDFIMRYERLQEDFDKVMDYLGKPRELLPKTKSLCRPAGLHYRDVHDEETKQLTAKYYAEIIKKFGYEF